MILKFRAWEPENKVMVYFDADKMSCDVYIAGHFINLMGRGLLEQFTGLTDKNGKDIYDGDILKARSETIKPFAPRGRQKTGEFKTSYKAIEYRDSCASFCIVGSALTSISQNICTEYYEVIGNIHQHPELIGGNNNDT